MVEGHIRSKIGRILDWENLQMFPLRCYCGTGFYNNGEVGNARI